MPTPLSYPLRSLSDNSALIYIDEKQPEMFVSSIECHVLLSVGY